MHGNVWQWCADLVDPKGSARVFRGGCWSDNGSSCRAAARAALAPGYQYNRLDFRLARVPVR
jgi:sulfatase modifying factor 1